jgi:hypothetical protein
MLRNDVYHGGIGISKIMGGRTLVFGSRGEMGLADVDRHVVPKDSGPPCTISKLTMTANEALCRAMDTPTILIRRQRSAVLVLLFAGLLRIKTETDINCCCVTEAVVLLGRWQVISKCYKLWIAKLSPFFRDRRLPHSQFPLRGRGS